MNINNFMTLTNKLNVTFSEMNIQYNPIEEEFGEEYKELVESAVKETQAMVNTVKKFPKLRTTNLLIIEGQGGTGKTYNVEQTLKANNIEYESYGSKIDATGLYKAAYDHRNSILVFDDCDSVLGGGVINNLMKNLCQSKPIRHVTYSNKTMIEDGYEESFDYQGKIIILTNKHLDATNADNQALLSRAIRTALDFTNMEKVANGIHIMCSDMNKITDKDVLKRYRFSVRFMWENRQYFANDVYSMRDGQKFPDLLDIQNDDVDAFVRVIQKQDCFKLPDDAAYHRFDTKQM